MVTADTYTEPPAASQPYAGLTPDTMLDAIDSLGLRSDGRLLAFEANVKS